MNPSTKLLLLDAHGILLNAYWPEFLHRVAGQTGEPHALLDQRWHDGVRQDAWLGRIDDRELWRRLIPDGAGRADWRDQLEAGYRLGPAASSLGRWARRVPIWVLSNHRSHWLLPRLNRFGLTAHLERVLVSDRIAAMKPQAEAFGEALRHAGDPRAVLFVDDQACNVSAARRLGMQAVHAERDQAWIPRVDALLDMTADQGLELSHRISSS